ncbi:SUN domain-containing protein 1 isoform X13 [Tachysurus fulvidraco]|uniref:SUN domain-containing protein 1 isoform X13 n=1 Tax=Tachysurus fulvidraco TaxID=1234273 RepID=UPI000F4E7BAA|nr:SUN domain-containing protein 1 isoform X13 [Tachysurus fulvidraco]
MVYSKVHTRTAQQQDADNTGYTYSVSSSYSSSALEYEREHKLAPVFESPRMTRRSLRLHTNSARYGDDSLLDSSVNRSVSFSTENRVHRESKTVKSRRSQRSVSGSSTLLQTPVKSQSLAQQAHNSSMHSCAASDASLLSSMLDESSIQERTLVDSFWGLDKDGDLKDQTLHTDHSFSLNNSGTHIAQTQTSTLHSGYICSNCVASRSDRRDALQAYSSSKTCSSSSCSYSSAALHSTAVDGAVSAPSAAFSSPHTTVYSRERSRRHRAGSAASGALQWLGTAWYQMVMLMSLLNVFFLTRILPILQKLFLIILPFILSLAVLWYWGMFSFSTLWPIVNITGDSPINKVLDVHPDLTLSGKTIEVEPDITESEASSQQELPVVSEADSERLARIEQSLGMLWDKVAASGGKQEERHAEVLGLCSSLKEELRTNTDKESMGQWVGSLLEQRLSLLRAEMEEQTERSQQHQDESEAKETRETQESRLAKIEALLQELAQRTEELQTRPDPETPSVISEEMDSVPHAALLAQVHKLEEALSSIRADLRGVTACTGRCEQLDSLHDTISAQVKKELQVLLYGSEQKDVKLPGSLMQWLSTQFVSNSDLLDSLGTLEKRILGNLSLQIEEMQQKPSEETITQSVLQATEQSGLSEEDIQLIVQNALKLYSEDRIGLVDYALESGGGSILSTRCSETYETKTALMSLFGFPLWYFSQSPRAVIQPDVHPGNCWAFKGSTGYLVIRLCVKIVPTAFSLEHIPKALSPTGNISSAPRNFTVYGLEDEQQEEGHLLGEYVYQEDGDALQTYLVTENDTEAFQIIELRVLSNWGHPEYTCLYRFRVHGEPVQQ